MTVSSVTSSRRFNSFRLSCGAVAVAVLVLVAEPVLLDVEFGAESTGIVVDETCL